MPPLPYLALRVIRVTMSVLGLEKEKNDSLFWI
jgi:hypothetical protein